MSMSKAIAYTVETFRNGVGSPWRSGGGAATTATDMTAILPNTGGPHACGGEAASG